MDKDLLYVGLAAAALLYFGSDIKKVTGAVGNVVQGVSNIATLQAPPALRNPVVSETTVLTPFQMIKRSIGVNYI